MKITNKQIFLFLLLLIIGVLYSRYINKLNKESHKEEFDLIHKYLLKDFKKMNKDKPYLWIHLNYDINERMWINFGSRNTNNLNQLYLYLTIRSIIEKCGNSFNVCIIDDNVFNKILPGWEIRVGHLSNPLKPHLRELAMAKVMNMYGGFKIPASFICFKDLKPLYDIGLSNNHAFIGEMLSRNSTSSKVKYFPDTRILGCVKNCPIMKEYITYLEMLISSDYTNEMDFIGDCGRWFYKQIVDKNVAVLSASYFGIKKQNGSSVTIEDVLGDSDVNLHTDSYGLYIPADECLTRRVYGWFVRMSPKQVLESNTLAGKYLLASN